MKIICTSLVVDMQSDSMKLCKSINNCTDNEHISCQAVAVGSAEMETSHATNLILTSCNSTLR